MINSLEYVRPIRFAALRPSQQTQYQDTVNRSEKTQRSGALFNQGIESLVDDIIRRTGPDNHSYREMDRDTQLEYEQAIISKLNTMPVMSASQTDEWLRKKAYRIGCSSSTEPERRPSYQLNRSLYHHRIAALMDKIKSAKGYTPSDELWSLLLQKYAQSLSEIKTVQHPPRPHNLR